MKAAALSILATILLLAAAPASAQPFSVSVSPRSAVITNGTASFTASVSAEIGFSGNIHLSAISPTLPEAIIRITPGVVTAPYTSKPEINVTLTGPKIGGTHEIYVLAGYPTPVRDTIRITIPSAPTWKIYNFRNSPYGSGEIALDRRAGALWFANPDSVRRFDGTTFKGYRYLKNWGPSATPDITVDMYGRFWLLSSRILGCLADTGWVIYDGRTAMSGPTFEALSDFKYIERGEDSTIWAFGPTSMVRLDQKTGVWTTYTVSRAEVPDEELRVQPVVDRNGDVWFRGTRSISMFDGTSWTIFPGSMFDNDPDPAPIALDPENRMWVRTRNGTWAIEASRDRATQITDPMYVRLQCLKFDSDGQEWSGTEYGLHRYQNDQWWHYTIANSGIPSDNVRWIDVDDLGRAWIKTFALIHTNNIGEMHAFAVVSKTTHPSTLYSGLSSVDRTDDVSRNGSAISIVPNPSHDRARVDLLSAHRQHLRVSLVDRLGRELRLLADRTVEAGTTRLDVDLSELDPGLYFVRSVGEESVASARVVVIR